MNAIRVIHCKAWNIHSGHRPDEWNVSHPKFPGSFNEKTRHDAVMRIAWMRLALSRHGIEDVGVEWTHGPGAHPDCRCHVGRKVVTGGVPEDIARIDREAVATRERLQAKGLL